MLEVPAIPAVVLTIINLLAPLAIAVVNSPKWSPGTKRLIAVAASLLLSLIALAAYYTSGEPVPGWPTLLVLGLFVSQASYALILEKPSKQIERSFGTP